MNRILTATLGLAAAAAAQSQITSPAGYLAKEGSSDHNYILFSRAEMRWQQIDNTNRGVTVPIKTIAWRRDAAKALDATYIARTMDNFEVWLADADVANLQVANLDLNYKTPATNVFLAKKVNVPDWTAKPATSPGPWTVVLPLDVPWIYKGVDDLLWEVRYTANSAPTSNYGFDFQSVGTDYNSTSGTIIGTSCKTTGQTSSITLSNTLYNHGTKFRLYTSASYLPASSTMFLNIDALDQNLAIPGLCGVLHALPLIYVAYATSATGATGSQYLDNIPHDNALVGVSLYTQAWALDPGQAGIPVVVSYGRKLVMPATPPKEKVIRFYHYKNSGSTSLVTSGPWTGGIVALLGL